LKRQLSVAFQNVKRFLGVLISVNANQVLPSFWGICRFWAWKESVRRLGERNPGEEEAKKEGRDSAFLEEKVEFIVHAGTPLESLNV
jgi:hypothetical protein